MKRFFPLAVLVLSTLGFSAAPAAAAPATPKGPPAVIDSGTLVGFCSFEVPYSVTGKTKVITTGTARTITISPAQKITLQNGKKTVSYVITGTRREVVRTDGNLDVNVTGRNILINNQSTAQPGIFLVVGNFNFVLTPKGGEVTPFNPADGQVTNICEALA